MFPTQYPTNVIVVQSVRFVLPATFDGTKDHAKNVDVMKVVVMKCATHLGHLYCGWLGRAANTMKPTIPGMLENIMIHLRVRQLVIIT